MSLTLKCCGPKMSTCGIVISIWGMIQLFIMALAFQGHNVALVEDLDLPEERFLDTPKTYLEALEKASQVSAHNCWVAVGLYVVTLVVSLHQFWVNTRAPSSGYQRQY